MSEGKGDSNWSFALFLFMVGVGWRIGQGIGNASVWDAIGILLFWPWHIGYRVADWLLQK